MGEQKPSFEEAIKQCGGDFNSLTKSLIVSMQITKNPKAEQIKKEYFENFVVVAIKNKIRKATKEELTQILMIEELEKEILQKQIDIIKSKLEEKNVSIG